VHGEPDAHLDSHHRVDTPGQGRAAGRGVVRRACTAHGASKYGSRTCRDRPATARRAQPPRLRQYTKRHTIEWSAIIDASDAFVFVTPEYNYGYPASLKNAIDYLHQEWLRKPVGFVSYGGVAAGTRSVQQLKQVVTCLSMMP